MRALHVKQLFPHLLISGGVFRGGRGSQRRLRSRSILYTIFESSSLAQLSCFLMLLWVLKATVGLFGKSLESSGDFLMRCQCLASNLVRWCVGRCGEYVVVNVRRSPLACGLLARVFCLSGNVIPRMVSSMVSSMVSCLHPLFFIFSTLANLSPLYKHRSKNVISPVENSAVKLMRWCRSLMLLMNCSRLSFVSVHTKNISSMCISSNVWGRGLCRKEFWIPVHP